MCVDSPSAIFNLERFRGQWVEHVVVNRGNAGLGTVSICLICVALVLSTRCLYLLTTMDMLGMSISICHMCILRMFTGIISVRLLCLVLGLGL